MLSSQVKFSADRRTDRYNVGKGKNAINHHLLHFPQYTYSKAFSVRVI